MQRVGFEWPVGVGIIETQATIERSAVFLPHGIIEAKCGGCMTEADNNGIVRFLTRITGRVSQPSGYWHSSLP